ncbi:hypothetical protein GCM10009839_08060 [Catenulispora yoronensis]|uniref:DUF7927 domain-containing protein n=1 Tax=Catenulispora yoronensis TaxID=450799 RepID=A0ABN2TN66_9ACTN
MLPANLGNPATTTAGCSIGPDGADTVLSCTGGALADGDDGPVTTMTGTAPATAGTDCLTGAISNSVQMIGNEPDPDFSNNAASSTACPAGQPVPSFTVAKTASVASPASVRPGDSVTYTITVTNIGPVAYTAANPATFQDSLRNVSDDATLDPASLTNGATYCGEQSGHRRPPADQRAGRRADRAMHDR